jgi:hypothetical protein
MRRLVLLVLGATLLPWLAAPAGSAAGCDDAAMDMRTAAEALPAQGVVQVHHLSMGIHYQPSALDADGQLVPVDLLGFDGGPRLVSVWQGPADCTGDARDAAWAVTPEGHVYIGGTAGHFGHMLGQHLNQPIVTMAVTPTGQGYWLAAADGGIFSFGDARFLGSTGAITLNQPIVAMAPTPTGRGYWLAAADGGLFTFGDAPFLGSMGGTPLNAPIVGMVPTPTGEGYWMVARDGGVFTFGDAMFQGSTASMTDAHEVAGMIPHGDGYAVVDADGAITSFGAGDTMTDDGGHDHGDMTDETMTGPIISLDDPRLTEAQRQAAIDLIDRTTAGMARYPDEQAVQDAGFLSIGDAATGFEHYVNWGYLLDDHELDADRIESVVLRVADDGTKTVESAMYILSVGKTMDDVPDIAGSLTTWHKHDDLCFVGTEVVGLAQDGKCDRGLLLVTPPMLHVWLTPQPCGPFAGIASGNHGTDCHAH